MQRRETGPRTFGSNFDARSALIETPSEFLRVSGFWNQSEPMALDPPFLQNNTRLSQPAQPARKSQIPPTPPKLEQLDGEARTEIPYMKAESGTTVDLGVLAIATLRNDAGQSFPEQLPRVWTTVDGKADRAPAGGATHQLKEF